MIFEEQADDFKVKFLKIQQEISKVIVGHTSLINDVLFSVFGNGHALLEGVPGLGKTLLVRTLSETLDLKFSRVQFTPDLMPADIIGTNIIIEMPTGEKCFQFQKGPLFANIILADEINRATPKTQSALLEAMQEHSITAGSCTYTLEEPFFVLATQNPIEMEGTYPLPEAQLDRFLYKVNVLSPKLEELVEIIDRTTGKVVPAVTKVIDQETLLAMKSFVREVLVPAGVKEYVSRFVLATHPNSPYAVETVNRYVRYGASPRGAQAMIITAKIQALLEGRYNVSFDDVQRVVFPALRHRLILNFEGEAEGINPDEIIQKVLDGVPTT